LVTLQTFANIEQRSKNEIKEIKKLREQSQKVEYTMSECNSGNAFKIESASKDAVFSKDVQDRMIFCMWVAKTVKTHKSLQKTFKNRNDLKYFLHQV